MLDWVPASRWFAVEFLSPKISWSQTPIMEKVSESVKEWLKEKEIGVLLSHP